MIRVRRAVNHELSCVHPRSHRLIKQGVAYLWCTSGSVSIFEISDDSSNDSCHTASKFLYQAIMTLHTLIDKQKYTNSIEHVGVLVHVKQDVKHDTRPNIFYFIINHTHNKTL